MCNETDRVTKRGALIVLEGCDRSGKSTQCRLLVEKLIQANIPAELITFPDRTTSVGAVINDYLCRRTELPDQAVHLLFTANRWEHAEKIKSLLEKGVVVIVDRYSYSGVVYSAAKDMSSTSHASTLQHYKRFEEGLPKPDAVAFLHLDPETIAQRKSFGDERYELLQFQIDVAKCFGELNDGTWKIVDASRTIDEVTAELYSYVSEVVEKSSNKLIGTLW